MIIVQWLYTIPIVDNGELITHAAHRKCIHLCKHSINVIRVISKEIISKKSETKKKKGKKGGNEKKKGKKGGSKTKNETKRKRKHYV